MDDGVLPILLPSLDRIQWVVLCCVMSRISVLLASSRFGVAVNRVRSAVFVKHFPEQDQESKWRQGEYCEEELKYKHLMSLYDSTVTTAKTDR